MKKGKINSSAGTSEGPWSKKSKIHHRKIRRGIGRWSENKD